MINFTGIRAGLSIVKNLLKIADDTDRERTGKPAFLMVVTKNKVAYQIVRDADSRKMTNWIIKDDKMVNK